MKERIVDPSEIEIEDPNAPLKEKLDRVDPWIRFIGRFFDYSLFFLLLLWIRKISQGALPFARYDHWIPFEFLIWIPMETCLLMAFGTTPGKFLVGTKLKHGRRARFDLATAVRRSFAVWLRGLGMGIPVLNVLCLLFAYNRLKVLKMTSWDREDHIVVTHTPVAQWRIYFAVFVAVAGTLHYYSEKNRELNYASRGVVRSVDEFSLSARKAPRFHFST